jgi:hypothetical protein
MIRPGTKMEKAFEIFQQEKGIRKATIARLKSELKMKPTTAATYYNLCLVRLDDSRREINETLSSSPSNKYAVIKKGRKGIRHINWFARKKEAKEFLEQFHCFDDIVKGSELKQAS